MSREAQPRWQNVRLGDIVAIERSSKIVSEIHALDRVMLFSLPAFDDGGRPVEVAGNSIESSKYVVPSDCVLFSKLNPRIPRVWRVRHSSSTPSLGSTEFWPLKPRDRDVVDLDYLAHFLRSSAFLRSPSILPASSTNSHQRVDRSAFEGYELALPPLAEQRRIAEILSSVDEAIQTTQAVIEQSRKVKEGVLQRLLTKGIGHTHFKVSDAGQVPQSWRVIRVAEVATAKGGKRMPKGRPFATEPTPHPYIRVSDLKDGTISTSNLMYVLPSDQKEIKNYTISSKDVYISIAGTIGVSGTVPLSLDGAQLTENAAKLVIKSPRDLEHEFLARMMQSELIQRQIISAKGVGGGVPKLALFRIEQMVMPLPPIDEQREILRFARAFDMEIEAQVNILSNIIVLKSALMAELLTGRKRVSASLPLAAE